MELIGETIKDLFGKEKPITAIRSERDSIIYDFLNHLNDDIGRENLSNYKIARLKKPTLTKDEFKKIKGPDGYHSPLQARFVAFKMSHLTIQDMHYLWSVCKKAKNFSRSWWYELKPREGDKIRFIHKRN